MGPPGNFVHKALTVTPRRNFSKNLSYPLPWIFNCVHLWVDPRQKVNGVLGYVKLGYVRLT
jgi:hypothetical protein